MPDPPRVAVVGAGIAGLAVALELRRLGAGVVVVEARYPGAGNSTRNVGRVRGMQLTEDLTRFAVAARRKWDGVDALIGRRNALVFPTRYAWLLYGDDEPDRLAPLEPMWAHLGARARLVDAATALAAVPVLRSGEPVRGAVLGDAAIVHHDAAVHGYLLACRESGVDVRAGTAGEGVEVARGRVTALATARGAIGADAVVNAAGGLAGDFARACGIEAPNRPVRREVLVTEASRPFLTPAVTFYRPQEGWFNQTLRGELVAGVVADDEPEGMTEETSARFLARTARVLLAKAPRLGELHVIRQWAGVYDLTPDRRPLVGEHERLPGLFALSGWSGRGFAFAPLAAELLARWIVDGERSDMLETFAPDRFQGVHAAAPAGDYYSAYSR
jgi:sarcosine oxidase, subunit beta